MNAPKSEKKNTDPFVNPQIMILLNHVLALLGLLGQDDVIATH